MKMRHNSGMTVNKERGATTLLISLVLLTLITLVTLYTSRTVLMEQKIAANEYRSRVTFEAAEAGIDAAVNYISDSGVAALGPVFDSDGDGVRDTNTQTLTDGSTVTVTLTDMTTPDQIATQIVAVGNSADGAASRTITQLVALIDPVPNMPENPLVTRGTVIIGGSATVHNPEGASTIWSGGDVDLGSNNSTATEIADPADPNYPDCLGGSVKCGMVRASDRTLASVDVIEHDTNLSNLSGEEFFQNFFGLGMETYRDALVTLDVEPANIGNNYDANPPGLNLATNEIGWVEGDSVISGLTIGCATALSGIAECASNSQSSITIINGNVEMTGNVHIYGVLYVTGDVTVKGNVTVVGAMVVQGSNNVASGSMDITYSTDVLSNVERNGPPASSSGSWRDF